MRAFGILLLLLVCVAFRPACSQTQDDQRGITAKVANVRPPYALTISRQTRSLGRNLITDIFRITWDILLIPVRVIEFVISVIRLIEGAIRNVIQLILFPFRRILSDVIRVKRERPLSLVEDLFENLLFAIFHPFESIEEAIDEALAFANKEINNAVQDTLRLNWHFLSTTGLPWLRRTLDRIDKLPNVPPFIRTLIRNFDTMYNILQIFGYVSPAYDRPFRL